LVDDKLHFAFFIIDDIDKAKLEFNRNWLHILLVDFIEKIYEIPAENEGRITAPLSLNPTSNVLY
jgi:hypothetical protein